MLRNMMLSELEFAAEINKNYEWWYIAGKFHRNWFNLGGQIDLFTNRVINQNQLLYSVLVN